MVRTRRLVASVPLLRPGRRKEELKDLGFFRQDLYCLTHGAFHSVGGVSSNMDTESGTCPHLAAVLADPTESTAFLNRYKTAVRWNAHRAQDIGYPAKRRKVCTFSATVSHCRRRRLTQQLLIRSLLQNVASAGLPSLDHTPVCTAHLQDAGRTST